MLGHQKLEVWQLAKKLAISIYKITDMFPEKERFGLASQINRAAVSIASNIAEGNGRRSIKEKVHFTEIAYGSLMEVACQLEIALELGFINKDIWETVMRDIKILSQNLKKYSHLEYINQSLNSNPNPNPNPNHLT